MVACLFQQLLKLDSAAAPAPAHLGIRMRRRRRGRLGLDLDERLSIRIDGWSVVIQLLLLLLAGHPTPFPVARGGGNGLFALVSPSG